MTPTDLGRSIQHRRESLRLSRADLAEAVSADPVTVWKWEAGRIDLPCSTLVRVAVALRTSPSALLARAQRAA